MISTIRNVFIVGSGIVFFVLFLCVYEIWRSYALIAEVSDPVVSTQRGFDDASKEYHGGYAHFRMYNLYTPLVSEQEIELKYQDFRPSWGRWCGTGRHAFEHVALNLSGYQYNEYYVTAYNLRLKQLIDSDKKH